MVGPCEAAHRQHARTVKQLTQYIDDVNAMDVLEKGLQDLMDLCDVITDNFTAAKDEFGKTED